MSEKPVVANPLGVSGGDSRRDQRLRFSRSPRRAERTVFVRPLAWCRVDPDPPPAHLDDLLGDAVMRCSGSILSRYQGYQIGFAATSARYGRGVSRHRQRAAVLRMQPAVQRDKLTEMSMSTISSAPAALTARVERFWARVGAHLEALVRGLHHVAHRAGGRDGDRKDVCLTRWPIAGSFRREAGIGAYVGGLAHSDGQRAPPY